MSITVQLCLLSPVGDKQINNKYFRFTLTLALLSTVCALAQKTWKLWQNPIVSGRFS